MLLSSLKDTTIKIWDCILSQLIRTLSSHTKSVTCIKWGGEGLIYSSSQDRTIKVWRADDVSEFLYETNFFVMLMIGSIDVSLLSVIWSCHAMGFFPLPLPINPLTQKNDLHLISPYHFTPTSHIEVMRIKELITN